MPELTIPLIGQPTQRNLNAASSLSSGKDQRLIGVMLTSVSDGLGKRMSVYAQKRAGFELVSTPAAGSAGYAISDDGVVTGYGSTSAIYYNAISVGALPSGTSLQSIRLLRIGTENYYLINSSVSANPAFYLPNNIAAAGSSATFTADTTSGSPTLTVVSSFTGLYVGQALSGTGIPATARIQSMNASASTITMGSDSATPTNATATNSTVTITRSTIARVMSANLGTGGSVGTLTGHFVELVGRLFIMTTTGRIYQSDINDINTWGATDYITCNLRVDVGVTLARVGEIIYGICGIHTESFVNAGNAFGSILTRLPQSFDIGSSSFIGGVPPVETFSDKVFILGQNVSNPFNAGVYVLNKDGISKLSTQVIDNIINVPTSLTAIGAVAINGTIYCHVTQANGNYDYLYDVENKVWLESGWPTYILISNNGLAISGVATAGKKFRLDAATPSYQDDSAAFTMTIQTQPYYLNDGDPFFIDEITLVADTQASGSSALTTSANDYTSFETIGSFDLTVQQKTLPAGGYYDSHVIFKITDSGNQAWRGQALKIKWRPA